ncbi:helix-turn-helix domain-containing protein [Aquimarina algicola]|uniref:helix-turn-helix domain-containing protein n=1 Tax=Aquimarina algicola TaxID=2589995 RepID=UPI001CF5E1AE|nr:helix-turn-helix domain-containing protein [Aquimarina algicola]
MVSTRDSTTTTQKTTKTHQVGISGINPETLQQLLVQLQQFEEQHLYLQPNINVKDLAKSFGSNSSYLSKVVNTYKQKSMSQYINDLRIDYAITTLQTDATFRKYTIKAIAKEIGFNTPEAFAKKFYKRTGIYPSYFVKNLDQS